MARRIILALAFVALQCFASLPAALTLPLVVRGACGNGISAMFSVFALSVAAPLVLALPFLIAAIAGASSRIILAFRVAVVAPPASASLFVIGLVAAADKV